MEQQAKTSKEIRQRKFLLVLPLLALPFMTMIFWALGGGKVEKAEAQAATKKGFNINLPDAILNDDKPMDKMSYYNLAQQDSMKFLEMIKNDPNYKNVFMTDTDDYLSGEDDTFQLPASSEGLNTSLYGGHRSNDPNTDKIYRKLAELDREMNKPIPTSPGNDDYNTYQSTVDGNGNNTTVNSSDVDRLEQMMNMMNQPTGEDPEMKQINGMLDKILDVQYPERVQERLRQTSEANRGQVFVVSSQKEDNAITLLDTDHLTGSSTNGFYSLTGTTAVADSQNAIQAVVHETQTLVDGSTVKLRLVNDIFINGIHISKGNFLYGIASLKGERLNVEINSIRYNNSLFPVELSVYDMDGLDGIYIPGAITRDVAKQSADRSMQTLGLTTLDPSWQAQAAGAGIEAAKTLFSRKVKLVKVQVKAGYKVLLRNDREK
ncbi:MAG TPA: conjugative transposon protein TraM [Chitinophagaceae bacterium]|nr:conjugative transposon protein TraM [Chitinophagaceae bacterium]